MRAFIFADLCTVFLCCFTGHYTSFFGQRSWLSVLVSRVLISVLHGRRPRRRIRVNSQEALVSTGSVSSFFLVRPAAYFGNFGHGLSTALEEVRQDLVCALRVLLQSSVSISMFVGSRSLSCQLALWCFISSRVTLFRVGVER